MAERPFTLTELPMVGSDEQAWLAAWTGLAAGDTGEPLPSTLVGFADRSVQVAGTFGGATLAIQGSADLATYVTLHDPGMTAINFTAAGTAAVVEVLRTMRPAVTGGDGTTNLNVYAVLRRTKR
jgi:hypothetical protein